MNAMKAEELILTPLAMHHSSTSDPRLPALPRVAAAPFRFSCPRTPATITPSLLSLGH